MQYKLDPNKLKSYIAKQNSRVVRLLIVGCLTVSIVQLTYLKKELGYNSNLFRVFLPYVVTLLFFGLLFFLRKNYTILVAKSLFIIIDENSITKKIDLENTSRVSLLNMCLYNLAKRFTYGYFICIKFNQINSIISNKGDLWIYSLASDSFTGKGVLIIPQEIEKFDEIDSIIKNMQLTHV